MRSISTLCILVLLFVFTSSSNGQINWIKDTGNPVMSGAGDGTWNKHVFFPLVIYNHDSTRYEMWYGASAGPANNWYPYRVGFATSDDGINWEKYIDPVFETTPGAWDSYGIGGGAVIRENGSYKLWYLGYMDDNDPGGIGYATSEDGIIWEKDTLNNPIMVPSQEWESGGFGTVHVMPFEQEYKMWYAGYKDGLTQPDIGYASSPDGIVWVKDTLNNPVLSRGKTGEWDSRYILEPRVYFIDDVYIMFFVGSNDPNSNNLRQTGMATSSDGIHWKKYNDHSTTSTMYIDSDPVLKPSSGQWDGNYVQAGTVMLEGDSIRMWYSGSRENTGTFLWRIGHATLSFDSLQKYIVLSVDNNDYALMPRDILLSQNYPNPFNPSTTIEFTLPKSEFVELKVFNILGKEVSTLVSNKLNQGNHIYQFDGKNLASGVYYYQLISGDYREVKKMILLR
jgi:predicted GH43/DUF377 family glycosyl hydrolase